MKLKHLTKPYLLPFKIYNVSIYVHWSFCFAGLFLASAVGQKQIIPILVLIFSYLFLILLHEFGHAYAARKMGARVLNIQITGGGGVCYFEGNLNFNAKILVYSAGLIAQTFLFIITIVLMLLFGEPNSNVLSSTVFVFTFVNGFLFIVNLIPYGQNDGNQIYMLIRNKKRI